MHALLFKYLEKVNSPVKRRVIYFSSPWALLAAASAV